MSGGMPLVSVIITTFNGADVLERAIRSVLTQSWSDSELIVVDDNDPSSPARAETASIMRRYPTAVYLRHPENRNGAAARNTGLDAAKGTYVAFLDQDDVYLSMHIEACVKALESNPDCDAVLTGVLKIRQGLCWERVPAAEGDPVRTLLFSETALGTGSNLFLTAEAARTLNGFDTSFERHQDLEFSLRLFQFCRVCTIPEIQILKDMGTSSNSQNFERFRRTKQQLRQKFSDLIEGLTEEDRARFDAGQYSALLYTACREGNAAGRTWAAEGLKACRPLTRKERLLCLLSRFGLFPLYERMKLMAKKRAAPRPYQQVIRTMGTADRALLDAVLHPDQAGGRGHGGAD